MNSVQQLAKLLPRQADAHKGAFGRVLVVAGSRGMSGAAVLCGSAALRGGAGLVTVACPEDVWPIIAAGNSCYMTLPLRADTDQSLLAAATAADVVVVGPGLGRSASATRWIKAILDLPVARVVVDADALNAVAASPELLSRGQQVRILTPHPGEFARLTSLTTTEVQARREVLTEEWAARFAAILVLKGHATLVCDGHSLYRNGTGNPGMATAGSGDVLSGIMAALWAQGLSAFAAAQLGVYLHGLAGDMARDQLGETSLTAADLLDYLPRAMLAHAAG